ncbi:MAG TPA: hypothetical protein VGS19_02120 [Streptosporangiaceae bacterium]|nr:hypothetical protein [Streptosporangiaceae bacterium]
MAEGAGRPRYVPPPWQGGNPVCTLSTRPDVKHDLGGGLRRFLADGEHLLGLVDMEVAPGRRNIESPPEQRPRGQKAAELAVGAAAAVAAGGGSPSLNAMLGIESARGRTGSWAERVLKATWVDRGRPRYPHYLFVSDQRLVLAGLRTGGEGAGYQAALELPREAVADVRLVPKPLVRGRVVMDFTDGSMVALKYGTWRAGVARRVVDAVEQWRRQSAGY